MSDTIDFVDRNYCKNCGILFQYEKSNGVNPISGMNGFYLVFAMISSQSIDQLGIYSSIADSSNKSYIEYFYLNDNAIVEKRKQYFEKSLKANQDTKRYPIKLARFNVEDNRASYKQFYSNFKKNPQTKKFNSREYFRNRLKNKSVEDLWYTENISEQAIHRTALCLIAYVKFKTIERQINHDEYFIDLVQNSIPYLFLYFIGDTYDTRHLMNPVKSIIKLEIYGILDFKFFKTTNISNPLVEIDSILNLTDFYPDVDFFSLADMRVRNGDIEEVPDLIKFMKNSIDTDWAGYPPYMFIKNHIKFAPTTTFKGNNDTITKISFPGSTNKEFIKKLTNGFKISIAEYNRFRSTDHYKVELLEKKIRAILKKWNYIYINDFIRDVSKGLLEDAEDDAIDLENLKDKWNESVILLDPSTDQPIQVSMYSSFRGQFSDFY